MNMKQKTKKEIIIKWFNVHSTQIINGLKWITLLIFLFLIIRFIDLEDVKSAFSEISISIFLSFIGILLISRVLYAARWKIINRSLLNDENIPISYFFSTNLLADFLTIALPSSIGGEVARFLKINRYNQDGVMTTAGIFIDRMIGVATMVIVSITVLLLMGQEVKIDIHKLIPQNYLLPFFFGALLAGGLIIYGLFRWVKTKALAEKIKTTWELVNQNRLGLLFAAVVSITAHIVFSISHITIFQRLFPLPPLSVIGVILTPQLARSIPISLFGVSGGEGLMIISQMMVGMSQSTALVITFLSLIARYLFAMIGFLVELITDGKKFIGDLQKEKA